MISADESRRVGLPAREQRSHERHPDVESFRVQFQRRAKVGDRFRNHSAGLLRLAERMIDVRPPGVSETGSTWIGIAGEQPPLFLSRSIPLDCGMKMLASGSSPRWTSSDSRTYCGSSSNTKSNVETCRYGSRVRSIKPAQRSQTLRPRLLCPVLGATFATVDSPHSGRLPRAEYRAFSRQHPLSAVAPSEEWEIDEGTGTSLRVSRCELAKLGALLNSL